MKSVIQHISHPHSSELWMARTDHAKITGHEHIERPYWYHDTETGYDYHDLYACIGWPQEVSDKDLGMPGYAAVVAVIRPSSLEKYAHYDPRDAVFVILAEAQSPHAPELIDKCLILRQKYGFGVSPGLMETFLGDPERFCTVMALKNERLIEKGGDKNALLVAPPDDFYVPKIWDNYVRAIRFAVAAGSQRLGFLKNDILRNRIKAFKVADPAVLAAGGLIYSLLNRCMWMGQADQSTIFNTEETA